MGIVLAHVDPPGIVKMLRTFDVPCMILLSAILSEISFRNKHSLSVKEYLFSRFRRLVYPTWIFMTLYFLLYLILSGHPFELRYYIDSYALTRYGIGYVWIILIYLYCSFMVPLFHRVGFGRNSLIVIALIYVLYEIMYYYRIGTDNKVIMTTLYYIVPYCSLAFLGYHYGKMSRKTKYAILCISCIIFVSLLCYYRIASGSFQTVQIAKYPPRLYYLSYGCMCSFALLLLCENRQCRLFENPVVRFIASHSMWIYLWHILWLLAYDILHLPSVWYIRFFAVFISSSLTVIIVNKLLDALEKKAKYAFFRYLRG